MAHSIDLARYLVGELSEVTGMMETFIKQRPSIESVGGGNDLASEGEMMNVDVDDAVAFLARFENGAMGVFEASRFGKGSRNTNRIEINGSKGSIRWNMEDMNHLHLYLEAGQDGIQGFRKINCTQHSSPYIGHCRPAGHNIGYEHIFMNLMNEFLQGIIHHSSPSPSFTDGYRNQVVLDAVEQSAGSRQWVSIQY